MTFIGPDDLPNPNDMSPRERREALSVLGAMLVMLAATAIAMCWSIIPALIQGLPEQLRLLDKAPTFFFG